MIISVNGENAILVCMDLKDAQTAKNPQQPQAGGVEMAQSVYEAPAQGAVSQTAAQQSEDDTIVIPSQPAGKGQESVQPVQPPKTEQPQASSPPAGGRSPIGRILMIIVLLIALGGGAYVVISRFFSQSSPAQSGPVTITYWGLWENDEITRQFIADFETQNPGIKIQYSKESPRQYRERLQSAINRGEGPDVFRFHNTWIPMLRLQLATVPSEVMTVAEFTATFFPVASNNLVAGSSIYGLPLMIDGLGLYVNEDLFAAAGVSVPSTWTDLSNIVPKLTVRNENAIVTSAIALGTASNVEHFSDILGLLLYQNGANLLTLTGEEAQQTFEFYRSFTDPASTLYTWSDGMDNSISAFASGRVAMILAPSWRAFEISQMNPELRFRIEPVPQLQGNTVSWASYWVEGVSSRSKNQEAAWKFVKYLTSREGASRLYTEATKIRLFGEPYARVDLAQTIESDPYAGAFVKQASYARSFPIASHTHDNGLNDRLIKYITDAVNSIATGTAPAKALETASAGFRQVLSSYELVNPPITPTR